MKKFAASFESLRNFECPQWFRDAKFGIWSHWGPQSVPMYGDWYARHMYIQDHPQYLYHLRHYGHPSKFGYKDLCKLWKAEKFDPQGLMALYKKAGARYFVGQAMHHDHFFNYASKLNRFNSVQVGPLKDICGLWKAAAEKAGLPFGLTEHLGATFSWWKTNKGHDTEGPFAGVPYDGNDPECQDFYLDNAEHVNRENPRDGTCNPWYTTNKKFHGYWLAVMKELIDAYQPELLYSDGPLPFGIHNKSQPEDAEYAVGLEAVAYLYNASIKANGENRAVYNQKDRRPEIYNIGVLDIEKSQLPNILPQPWQTDTCIGNWFYDVRQVFKKPGHVIEMLIDIVCKNGNMLLNILQKPDGTIDAESHYLLDELAGWFALCGESIHGTRPWTHSGEGDARVVIDGFKEEAVTWGASDIRYTQKGDTVYAFLMRAPEQGVAVMKNMGVARNVKSVKLLGHGDCKFQEAFGTLNVKLPDRLPTKYTNVLAIKHGQ